MGLAKIAIKGEIYKLPTENNNPEPKAIRIDSYCSNFLRNRLHKMKPTIKMNV
jgi:hypothetical protein